MASDSSLAALLLVNRLLGTGAAPLEAAPLKASEFWPLMDRVGDPAVLLGQSAAAISDRTGLSTGEAERIERLLGGARALAFELDRLNQRGVRTLSPLDEEYPQRLRHRLGLAAPPILHVSGPPQLLVSDGIGVVGSRNVDLQGAEVARDCGRAAARRGLSTISGAARGVDRLAMGAALELEGSVVGVLADAMDRVVVEPDTRRAIQAGLLCLCSPYKPDAPFSAGNAMARNKIIYALARATVVVASDEGKGGTWGGASEAVRRRYGTVAVWRGPGEGPGNAALERNGAQVVKDVEEILELLAVADEEATNGPGSIPAGPSSPARPRPGTGQLRLDL